MLISSLDEFSGKTSIIIALGSILREKGYKIGYFKPIGIGKPVKNRVVDEDVQHIIEVLKLKDAVDLVCPVVIDKSYLEFILRSNPNELRVRIMNAYESIKDEKDIVIIEGSSHYEFGKVLGLCDVSISSMIDVKDLMIVKFSNDTVIDKLISAKTKFGEKLKYVIFNQIASYNKISHIYSLMDTIFKKVGLNVVGVIPKDPILAEVFINEIVEILDGKYLVESKESIIIEQVIVGAMHPQSALKYFRKAKNYAVITGGDRVDLIPTALESLNVKCLILTDNLEPPKVVIERAEEIGVPIIVVQYDTMTTMEKINSAFGRVRIRGDIKIKRIKELVKNHIDLDELLEKFI